MKTYNTKSTVISIVILLVLCCLAFFGVREMRHRHLQKEEARCNAEVEERNQKYLDSMKALEEKQRERVRIEQAEREERARESEFRMKAYEEEMLQKKRERDAALEERNKMLSRNDDLYERIQQQKNAEKNKSAGDILLDEIGNVIRGGKEVTSTIYIIE